MNYHYRMSFVLKMYSIWTFVHLLYRHGNILQVIVYIRATHIYIPTPMFLHALFLKINKFHTLLELKEVLNPVAFICYLPLKFLFSNLFSLFQFKTLIYNKPYFGLLHICPGMIDRTFTLIPKDSINTKLPEWPEGIYNLENKLEVKYNCFKR